MDSRKDIFFNRDMVYTNIVKLENEYNSHFVTAIPEESSPKLKMD